MKNNSEQHGFVSILTVLFFITLISVITIGFTRFMIQERRQELEDELTKNAYNAALSGVEDAKQAMVYCSSSAAAADRTNCLNNLYTPDCPGFNSSIYFRDTLGIQKSSTKSQTSVTGEDAATAAQGYSCVVVKKDTNSLVGQTNPISGQGLMYELRTTAPYQTIRVYWQEKTTIGLPSTILASNPRFPQWNGNWPAVLRLSLISVPSAPFRLANVSQNTTFIFPKNTGGATALTVPGSVFPRQSTQCDLANSTNYRCYVDLKFATAQTGNQYIVLSSLYQATDVMIVAYREISPPASSVPLNFDGVQSTIDSTGYTSGISRRVIASVHQGDVAINTDNALDTGYALCKNFTVGSVATDYSNPVQARCIP